MTWRIYRHPSEEGSSDRAETGSETQDTVESVVVPEDPTAQLRADLNAAKAEAAEWQDRFLRKAAEFENYRKRADREKIDSIALAKSSVLSEFLPIADACERALKSIGESKNTPVVIEQFREGVELLYRQVFEILSRAGVVPMEVEGKRFDPRMHEAFSREETLERDEDTIVRELRRGYLFKDKLLRPAQVVVAVRPKANGKTFS
jgi:molecular chaperone GrpE